jgi:hypothetical protein
LISEKGRRGVPHNLAFQVQSSPLKVFAKSTRKSQATSIVVEG